MWGGGCDGSYWAQQKFGTVPEYSPPPPFTVPAHLFVIGFFPIIEQAPPLGAYHTGALCLSSRLYNYVCHLIIGFTFYTIKI